MYALEDIYGGVSIKIPNKISPSVRCAAGLRQCDCVVETCVACKVE